jgi:PPOX class probable F420-dependent enzyme
MAFELTKQAERRLTTDEVAWLTTVTPQGKPAPRPVWFIWDGQAIVVYSLNGAARLRYIEHNPQVTLHFNSVGGSDILVISGTARRLPAAPKPSEFPGLLAKYGQAVDRLGRTPQWYDDNFGEAILITPERTWSND